MGVASASFRKRTQSPTSAPYSEPAGEPGGEQGGGKCGEDVDGVIVQPAPTFRDGSKKGVHKEAGKSGGEGEHGVGAGELRESDKSDGDQQGGGKGSEKGSSERDGAVGAGGNTAEAGDEAGRTAEDLAEFGGNRVGGGFGHGGDHRGEGGAASKGDGREDVSLGERDAGEDGDSEIGGDLGGGAAAASFRGAESLLATAAEAGGREGEDEEREERPHGRAEAGGLKPERSGEEGSGECGGGSGGAGGEDEGGEEESDAGSEAEGDIAGKPEPASFKSDPDGDDRHKEKEHSLGLPAEVVLVKAAGLEGAGHGDQGAGPGGLDGQLGAIHAGSAAGYRKDAPDGFDRGSSIVQARA